MGISPAQVLADAGYRREAVMAELAITQPEAELVIALGREGKVPQPSDRPDKGVNGRAHHSPHAFGTPMPEVDVVEKHLAPRLPEASASGRLILLR